MEYTAENIDSCFPLGTQPKKIRQPGGRLKGMKKSAHRSRMYPFKMHCRKYWQTHAKKGPKFDLFSKIFQKYKNP